MTKTHHSLVILPGDGIGHEVMAEVKKVIQWVEANTDLSFELTDDHLGGTAIDAYGVPLSDATLEKCRNADAVLLPFVLFHYTDQRNDRGLFLARRAAGATVLLIDTNYGYLIWAGGRRAEVVQQRLINSKADREIEAPGIDMLLERLLVDDLLKDFPGRQVYR